jgi:hypothetical protein
MHDVSDYELQKPDTPPPPARKPPSPLPLIVAVAVLAAGAALFVYLRREAPVPPSGGVAQTDVAIAPEPERPLGGDAEPIELPTLDDTDPLVREMVRMLSSHPRVAAWLTTNGLIRNFTVSVENIAGGRTPSVHQRALKPQAPFAVLTARGGLTIDTRSYNRYNDLAAAVASIDATGAAQLYTRLKPRIEDAYRDLGHQTPFDRALEASIVTLLQVPIVEGDVALIPRGALFQFNDPRLERLTAAQKQLLRMGPRNVRVIQRALREIGVALGIPAERLRGAP